MSTDVSRAICRTAAEYLRAGRSCRPVVGVSKHCVGPLGVGTLIVKPLRHLLHLTDLHENEAAELGPLLRRAARVVTELCNPAQVYVCLWSHGPAHIHFVVQPVSVEIMSAHGAHGPALQVGMFETGDLPDARDVETFADRARKRFAEI